MPDPQQFQTYPAEKSRYYWYAIGACQAVFSVKRRGVSGVGKDLA